MSVGMWGKKLGMTQVYDGDRVVPVTAIDVSGWKVLGVCTKDNNGYSSVRVGLVKQRYADKGYDSEWLKNTKKFFSVVREIRLQGDPADVVVGEFLPESLLLETGNMVKVSGKTRGRGFAGVVRRHDFAGAPGSHGSTMGNRPGSLSFMCSQGRVIKGKKMPGHMGNVTCSVKGLKVVKIDMQSGVLLVAGAIPGHKGSLVCVNRQS